MSEVGEKATHFGFQRVPEDSKAERVAAVFDSVASRYDLMNDLMSGGLHRLWKSFTVSQAYLRPDSRVLDIAGGTGDMSRAFANRLGENGQVWLTDINLSMLTYGRRRLQDDGKLLPVAACNAEDLPFSGNYFDCVSVAFGLRNMTHKSAALSEMFRVLKPGGRLLVLEFSHIFQPLRPLYDAYSFQILPRLGSLVTGDADSYRYLAESIRMHPDQECLKEMLQQAGFDAVEYFNLTLGVVALHRGIKY